ncbi:MAG: polysaccharide deacetylase family protein [Pseudonocardiaceae bacterium]
MSHGVQGSNSAQGSNGVQGSDSAGVPEANTRLSRIRRAALHAAGPVTTAVGSLVAVRTRQPHAVLTFDDGPEPGSTDRVLSVLAERRATATFFVLVRRAQRYPALLNEIVAAGHEIGLHGIDHRRLTRVDRDEVRRDLADGHAQLQDLLGARVRWFRPPYGAQTPSVWRSVRRQGLEPVLWGPCAWDWLPRPEAQLAAQALRGLDRGTVLLAHDGFALSQDGAADVPVPRIDRADLVRRITDGMAERGLAGCSLTEALVHGTPRLVPWFRH